MMVLLDTNVVIEHLKVGSLSNTRDEIDFAISVITEAELFQLAGMAKMEESSIEKFLAITRCLSIDSAIARRAALLAKTRNAALPDLLIAATAIEWNMPLLTRNVKDFKKLPGLELLEEVS